MEISRLQGAEAEHSDLSRELLQKREEAISRISAIASEMEKEIASVGAIDSVLALFYPDHISWQGAGVLHGQRGDRRNAASAPRTQAMRPKALPDTAANFFGNDERTAVVKAILREASRPLTSVEVTVAYEDRKGVRLEDRARARVTSRVSAILARLRNQGLVTHVDNEERRRSWQLV